MLLAELAILFHFDAVGSILFVFVCPVVTVFAFGAGQGDISPHGTTSFFWKGEGKREKGEGENFIPNS